MMKAPAGGPLRKVVSDKCAEPGHGRRDDGLRNTPEFLDNETGVESNDPVGSNPARERETALHGIGRIEGDAVTGLWDGRRPRRR